MAKGGSRGGRIPAIPAGRPVAKPARTGRQPAGDSAGGKGGNRGGSLPAKPGGK